MKSKVTDSREPFNENSVVEDEAENDRPTRRDFLRTTAGGTAAVIIASCSGGGDNGQNDSDSTGDSENNNSSDNDTSSTGPAPSNRVVRVVNSNATSWNGVDPTDFYQYANQEAVDAMVARGVQELTGESNVEAAWRALVPYNSGELVLIHLNAYVGNDNSQKNNVAAPISAVVYGLADILGIPASSIAICDPSRTLNAGAGIARVVNGCRHSESIAWDLYSGEYTLNIPFPSGQGPGGGDTLARVTAEADHIIMMPVLSWHGFNWITGAMKMMCGSLRSAGGSLHDGMSTGPNMADFCLTFKDRVRLLVADGLFGNIQGNSSSPHAFETLGGQSGTKPSSTLYFSKDMVATDSVMYDDLLDEARAGGSPKSGYGTGFLAYAADADHRLGTFEMRDETGSSTYSKIDLVHIDLT